MLVIQGEMEPRLLSRGLLHPKSHYMRQIQFIPHIAGKPANRTIFTAYFLTDEALYQMVADLLDRGDFSEKPGNHELRIIDHDGTRRSYYTTTFKWPLLKVLAGYSRKRKEAIEACKRRWPVFWRIAGEKWKIKVVLREMEGIKAP